MWAINILLSIVAGVLYRLGGIGKPFNTKYRDFGTPLCGIAILILNNPINWMIGIGLFLTFGASFGTMTSYFKKRGSDAMWWNWLIVGLMFGISALPYAWATGQWMPLLYRTVITACFVTIWSETISWDDLEEFERGFIFCASLLVF